MATNTGPVAVVTGGGRGIGRGLAERLLGEGYRVAVLERDPAARVVMREAHLGDGLTVLETDIVGFLLSPEAGFITGQNFVIDGGMTRKMIYAE